MIKIFVPIFLSLLFIGPSVQASYLSKQVLSCSFQVSAKGKVYNGILSVNDLLDVQIDVLGSASKILSCHYSGRPTSSPQSAGGEILVEWDQTPCDVDSKIIKQLQSGFLKIDTLKSKSAHLLNFYGPGPLECSSLVIKKGRANRLLGLPAK